MAEIKKERLLSLDVLRGADLFFLLILEPVLRAVVKVTAGLLLSLYFPIIKKIWNSSMTLYSGGICVLLMALFYFWIMAGAVVRRPACLRRGRRALFDYVRFV